MKEIFYTEMTRGNFENGLIHLKSTPPLLEKFSTRLLNGLTCWSTPSEVHNPSKQLNILVQSNIECVNTLCGNVWCVKTPG